MPTIKIKTCKDAMLDFQSACRIGSDVVLCCTGVVLAVQLVYIGFNVCDISKISMRSIHTDSLVNELLNTSLAKDLATVKDYYIFRFH